MHESNLDAEQFKNEQSTGENNWNIEKVAKI